MIQIASFRIQYDKFSVPQSTSFTLGLDLITFTKTNKYYSLDEAQRVSVRLYQLRSQKEIFIISDNLKQGVEETDQCHIRIKKYQSPDTIECRYSWNQPIKLDI